MILRLALVLLAVATLWSQAQTEEGTPAEEATIRKSVQDADLKEDISKRFANSAIATDEFEVEVRSGVVILRGRTDVVQHKGVATRLARLAGASEVDNRIEVTDRARERASRAARSQPRRVHVERPRSEGRDEQ